MVKRFVKDFFLGLKAFYEAIIFTFQYWLWPLYAIPIILSVGVYWGGDYLLNELKNINIQGDLEKINFENELENISFEGFPIDSYEIQLLIIGIKLVLMVTCLKLSKYVILIALSPLLTLLSAKTEEIITGNKYPFSFEYFLEDLYRATNFALRNMGRQMVIYSIWYLISLLLPFINVITPFFYFGVGAYYYGASLIDYTNERRRLNMNESIIFIRKNFGLTMSIGSIFLTLFFLSYIGIIIGPITCVIAATIAIHYKYNLKKSKHAIKTTSKKEKTTPPVRKKAEKDSDSDEWG